MFDFCRPSLRSILNTLTGTVNQLMAAIDDLNAKESALETVVGVVANAVSANTALLGTIHAELVAALANQGASQDPAIQAVADKLGAQVPLLQQAADALNAAATANPDPTPVTPPAA